MTQQTSISDKQMLSDAREQFVRLILQDMKDSVGQLWKHDQPYQRELNIEEKEAIKAKAQAYISAKAEAFFENKDVGFFKAFMVQRLERVVANALDISEEKAESRVNKFRNQLNSCLKDSLRLARLPRSAEDYPVVAEAWLPVLQKKEGTSVALTDAERDAMLVHLLPSSVVARGEFYTEHAPAKTAYLPMLMLVQVLREELDALRNSNRDLMESKSVAHLKKEFPQASNEEIDSVYKIYRLLGATEKYVASLKPEHVGSKASLRESALNPAKRELAQTLNEIGGLAPNQAYYYIGNFKSALDNISRAESRFS